MESMAQLQKMSESSSPAVEPPIPPKPEGGGGGFGYRRRRDSVRYPYNDDEEAILLALAAWLTCK